MTAESAWQPSTEPLKRTFLRLAPFYFAVCPYCDKSTTIRHDPPMDGATWLCFDCGQRFVVDAP